MPPYLLLAPVLLLAVLVLVLRVTRRRRSASGGTAKPERASEEVRLLRLQVATLTDALHEATGRTRPTAEESDPVEPVEPVEPVVLAKADRGPELEPVPTLESVLELPSVPAEVEPLTSSLAATAVGSPVAALPPAADHTAHAYADLSRTLAGSGRLREAALAQWAADLRVLGPLLEGRGRELCEMLGTLAPLDSGMAISGARAVASALVGPSVAVTAMLPDASHLTRPQTAGPRSAYPTADVSADVLPDHLVRALETALVSSAEDGGDRTAVSVGLRCDLVAHVVPGHRPDETVALVRDVLEAHERPLFDDALGGSSAGRAS